MSKYGCTGCPDVLYIKYNEKLFLFQCIIDFFFCSSVGLNSSYPAPMAVLPMLRIPGDFFLSKIEFHKHFFSLAETK